ncbi:MAG: DUF1566 domain-containing protein [Desulfamplus sp.]|nr:DUF1566 domain-containing protein [Desulfamplus sp.]
MKQIRLMPLIWLIITTTAYSAPVPDTGITKCYNDSAEIPCPKEGEDFYGQDGNYSINPMSYTKLDATGVVLPITATPWAMVKDNVTGLVWENNSHKSRWDRDAPNVIAELNNTKFGGYSDWRLPTMSELGSIVDFSVPYPGPTIDINYFKDTFSFYYWSSSTFASSISRAWCVYFVNGHASDYVKYEANYVRAVRAEQTGSFDNSDHLVINGDGTVTDSVTGLMWQQDTAKTATGGTTMIWKDALAYSENMTLGGYTDWRLPTVKELRSIMDSSSYSPAIDTSVFRDTFSSFYWSSSTNAYELSLAWIVSFYIGDDGYSNKGNAHYVRAVRAGQSDIGSLDNLIISVSPISQSAANISGTTTFDVSNTGTGTMNWIVSVISGSDWLRITSSESGSNTGTITCAFDENTSTSERTGTIIITAEGAAGSPKDVTVTQAGAVIVPDPDPQPTSGMGKAIILAGGGGNTSLYPFSNKLCQQMYRLLKQRGFTDDDIIYMNPYPPDIDENGYPDNERLDYNLFDPQTQLKEAFAKAAQSLSQAENKGGQFILYVHGHAENNFLKLTGNDEISATELQVLLNTIPAAVQQIVILDTCYSGSFMDELAGAANKAADRIVITSSDDKTVAWNTGVLNFSDRFIRRLRAGHTLQVAFEDAEDMMKGNPQIFGEQAPRLDDNGDGLYNSVDGVHSSTVYIGKEGVQAADPPSIQNVHPAMEIAEGKADGVIWVRTSPSGEGRIKTVKAVLMPPDFSFTEYQGEETRFNEISLELKYNGADDRYQITYDNFRQKGKWKIAYQAQGIDGQWSEIKFGEVNAGGMSDTLAVSVGFNQSEYLVSDTLLFDVTLNGRENIDLYVALLFPQGYFVSFTYPLALSFPGQLIPYQSNIPINGLKTFNILELPLPKELSKGIYTACAVAASVGSDPWAVENWFCYDCKSFELK